VLQAWDSQVTSASLKLLEDTITEQLAVFGGYMVGVPDAAFADKVFSVLMTCR
jgi:hypothetical protein